ncbi:hypothetical protein PG984_002416 [Apiospora sp. TS-2023a]
MKPASSILAVSLFAYGAVAQFGWCVRPNDSPPEDPGTCYYELPPDEGVVHSLKCCAWNLCTQTHQPPVVPPAPGQATCMFAHGISNCANCFVHVPNSPPQEGG